MKKYDKQPLLRLKSPICKDDILGTKETVDLT